MLEVALLGTDVVGMLAKEKRRTRRECAECCTCDGARQVGEFATHNSKMPQPVAVVICIEREMRHAAVGDRC